MSTETQARPRAAAAPSGAFQLSANDWEQGYLLPEGPTTIGAGPKCDLRLDGPGLRPLHCVVVVKNGAATVRRWAPGAKLNGGPFTESVLTDGDCLSIGGIDLHFCPAEGGVGEPDAADPRAHAIDQLAEQQAEPARANDEEFSTTIERAAETGQTAELDDASERAAAVADDEPEPSDTPLSKCKTKPLRAAGASPIPPHLLRPWEARAESLAAMPGQPAAGDLTVEPAAAEAPPAESTSPEDPAEPDRVSADEPDAVSDSVSDSVSDAEPADPAALVADVAAYHDGDQTEAPDDPQGIEFYTDVNWQAVENVLPGVHESAHPGAAAATPISLASMLQSRERMAAVRGRARQLVRALRQERAAAKDSRQELATFKARCEELAACVEELRQTLAEQEQRYTSLEEEKQSLDRELADLREAVSSQEAVNQELRDHLSEQADQIAKLSSAIDSWEAERESLKNELQAAQQQLAERDQAESEAAEAAVFESAAGKAEGAEQPPSSSEAAERIEGEVEEPVADQHEDPWTVPATAPASEPVAATETGEPTAPAHAPTTDLWATAIPTGDATAADRDPVAASEAPEPQQSAQPLAAGENEWLAALKTDAAAESASTPDTLTDQTPTEPIGAEAEPVWPTAANEREPSESAAEATPAADIWSVPAELPTEPTPAESASAPAAGGVPTDLWGESPTTDASGAPAVPEAEHQTAASDLWDIERASQAPADAAPTSEPSWEAPTWEVADAGAPAEPTANGASALANEEQPHETASMPAVDDPTPAIDESAASAEISDWRPSFTADDDPAPAPEEAIGESGPTDPSSQPPEPSAEQPADDALPKPAGAEHEAAHSRSEYQRDFAPAAPDPARGPTPIPDWLLGDDGEEDADEAATSDANADGGFEAPKSFLEQYSHLLPTDDEAVDAPADPPPSALASEPADDIPTANAGDTEEEDIDAYMSRLMERMRSGGVTSTPPSAPAESQSAVAESTAPMPVLPEPTKPEMPLLSLDEIKRSVQPEQSTDMASLRRLANDSARQAIGVAASKQSREQSVANLVIACIALASGGYLISSAPAVFSAQLVGGAFALLLSGVWVFRSAAHLLQAVRSGDYDGPVRESVTRDKLPINK